MGTCCEAHLITKVSDYASNAKNGAVTVNIFENPGPSVTCDYCKAPPRFIVSYYPK